MKYEDILDFQHQFPDKNSREAILKDMANEEIDELIDLCQSVQGKLYYQGFKKPVTIFRYDLKDAWLMPIRWIEVIDGAEAIVRYALDASKERWAQHLGRGEFTEEIRLPREELMKIWKALDDDRLFVTGDLERSFNTVILDGYVQEFSISSKGRAIAARGCNLQECEGDLVHCFHSNLMIETLGAMMEILVPLGVPKECFLLVRFEGRKLR